MTINQKRCVKFLLILCFFVLYYFFIFCNADKATVIVSKITQEEDGKYYVWMKNGDGERNWFGGKEYSFSNLNDARLLRRSIEAELYQKYGHKIKCKRLDFKDKE